MPVLPGMPVTTRLFSPGSMRGLIQLTAAAFGRTGVSTTCRRRPDVDQVQLGVDARHLSRSRRARAPRTGRRPRSRRPAPPPRNQPRRPQLLAGLRVAASRATMRSSMLVWKISSPWMAMFRWCRSACGSCSRPGRPAGRGGTPRSGRRSPRRWPGRKSCGFAMNITLSRTSGVPLAGGTSVARAWLQTSRRLLPTVSRSI